MLVTRKQENEELTKNDEREKWQLRSCNLLEVGCLHLEHRDKELFHSCARRPDCRGHHR